MHRYIITTATATSERLYGTAGSNYVNKGAGVHFLTKNAKILGFLNYYACWAITYTPIMPVGLQVLVSYTPRV